MVYTDYVWIYDATWMAKTHRERAQYHAFVPPNTISMCGRMMVQEFNTKTPKAPYCGDCLKMSRCDKKSNQ